MPQKIKQRIRQLLPGSHLGIVGGGELCKSVVELFLKKDLDSLAPKIVGVADKHENAAGMKFAGEKRIFTTSDFRKLFDFEELDLLMVLSGDERIKKEVMDHKQRQVTLLDRFDALLALDLLRIEEQNFKIHERIREWKKDAGTVEDPISQFLDDFSQIIGDRNDYLNKIRQELTTGERAMAQIIRVSAIPMFAINKDHIVTHWNKACEKLTGYRADELVGTNKHWQRFWTFKRPTMADLIVDGASEEDALKYYCTRWRKSALIDGAYEAEEYFSHFGEGGKWLLFSAAPIKAPDGTVVGAVETLWDRTEERNSK